MGRDFAEFDLTKPEKVRRLAKQAELGSASLFSQTFSKAATLADPNPQEQPNMISESEIKYLISVLKQKSDKWEQQPVLEELHTQACFTAKSLTQELIEGKVPINY